MLRQQTNKQTCSLPHRQHLKRALGSRFDTLLLDFKCNLFKIIKSCLKCYFNDFFFFTILLIEASLDDGGNEKSFV